MGGQGRKNDRFGTLIGFRHRRAVILVRHMRAGTVDRHDGLPGVQRRFRQYVDHLFAN